MTTVEGKIESLKRLRETLEKHGITRFSSLGEVRRFIKHYETERKQIPRMIDDAFERELQRMRADFEIRKQDHAASQATVREELRQEAEGLATRMAKAKEKCGSGAIHGLFYFPIVRYLSRRSSKLEHRFDSLIRERTSDREYKLEQLRQRIAEFSRNRSEISAQRCLAAQHDLDYTKEVVDSLGPLIAGAIGESAVVRALQQLSDDFYLFNDFSLEFDPPIFNKSEDDRIFTIQIDHLLVGRSGVFLLETKNWSGRSLESLDLRSPVKQILRTNFALFVLLNHNAALGALGLEQHHWGSKRVPIRNVVVMINERPKAEFKHVKVLSLAELVGYIKYFDNVLTTGEVASLVDYLKIRRGSGG